MYNKDIKKLQFILEKIDDAISYKDNFKSIEELLQSRMGFDAVTMCIMQIGETLKTKLSVEFQEKYGKVLPIQESYWTRNHIAHDYEGINKAIIENIIRYNLPKLKSKIQHIIEEVS